MVARRFSGRNPAIPAFLSETGHRHSNPQAGDGSPAEPSGQSPPTPPMRNAERIAADRQKIIDGGVLELLLAHVRGEIELTPSQISTAFGLLKKILPDFSSSAAPSDDEARHEEGDFPDPVFEYHIVDPKEA
jgi:hypothetical protein